MDTTVDTLTQDAVSNNPYVTSMGAFGANPSTGVIQAGFGPVNEFVFVPEPSTLALLTLGSFGLLARRRFARSAKLLLPAGSLGRQDGDPPSKPAGFSCAFSSLFDTPKKLLFQFPRCLR
jgi:hypothetical protein